MSLCGSIQVFYIYFITFTFFYVQYIHFIDTYLETDYTAMFVLCLILVMHLEGKLNDMYLGVYLTINQPCQWTKYEMLLYIPYKMQAIFVANLCVQTWFKYKLHNNSSYCHLEQHLNCRKHCSHYVCILALKLFFVPLDFAIFR